MRDLLSTVDGHAVSVGSAIPHDLSAALVRPASSRSDEHEALANERCMPSRKSLPAHSLIISQTLACASARAPWRPSKIGRNRPPKSPIIEASGHRDFKVSERGPEQQGSVPVNG